MDLSCDIAENFEKGFNIEELSSMAGISTSHFHIPTLKNP